tara:strand:+ start:3240 stop:4874 length:1635 start_codon:yes stop_codon:yes gene_type:complete
MARSVYGQLNQANIGQGIDTLLREIFEGDKEKYATESAVMDSLSSTASDEASFQKLDKVLDEYWRRNDMHGPDFEAKEIKQRADYTRRKDEFYQYKEAHNQALAMINPNYLVSSTDVDGGIQNITTNDVSSWNHKKLTEEMGKVGKIKDAFSLGEKGYSYNMGDKPQTTLSLARDVDTYYKTLTKALNIAVETDEIPKDEVLLRGIISGDASVVEKHMNEQQQIAASLYKDHNSNVDAYDALLNKVMAYDQKPNEFANLLGTLVSGKKPEGMTDSEHTKALSAIPFDSLGTDSFELNYMTYANNINASLTEELELRDNANKRHKAYTGKLYEDVGAELSEGMSKFRESGYSLEVVDEDEKKTLADGSLVADDRVIPKEGVKKPVISKSRLPKIEEQIMNIITPYKNKIISISGKEMRKQATKKAVLKYDETMSDAIDELNKQRKVEVDKKSFEGAGHKVLKQINKKYDHKIKQIKDKYYNQEKTINVLAGGGYGRYKVPTVDELFNEMDIFGKLMKNKIDLNMLGLPEDAKDELSELIIQYKSI